MSMHVARINAPYCLNYHESLCLDFGIALHSMHGSTPLELPFLGTHDTCCISDNNGNCYRNIVVFTVYTRVAKSSHAAMADTICTRG